MATTITIDGTDISNQYRDFKIEVPLSPVDILPTATIVLTNQVSVTAGDSVIIDINGTTAFDGIALSGGKKSTGGGQRLKARHPVQELWRELSSVNLETPTDEEVLKTAVSNAGIVQSFTVDYAGSATTLKDDYTVTQRTTKSIFRDMMERTGRVFWVEPSANIIHVEQRGGRGLWKDLDTQTDEVRLEDFDSGSIDDVVNRQQVVGTAGVKVRGSALDSTSIDEYDVQAGQTVNVSYISTQDEADAMAEELLIPDPLASGKLLAGQNVGDVVSPLVNQTVDITADGLDVDETGLTIEKQTIEQGRATLQIGEGSGVKRSSLNRKSKSNKDITEPGSVYDTESLAELSVTETRIDDNAVSTPKLVAEAVIASKIAADTITANEIAADTLTAGEVDTLDLDTEQLVVGDNADVQIEFIVLDSNNTDVPVMQPTADKSGFFGVPGAQWKDVYTTNLFTNFDDDGRIGSSSNGWAEVWAYDYFDASTGSTINDGGDILAGLADGHGAPDHCIKCDDDGNELGTSISELSHTLMDICREQQRRIDDLEARVAALEE